MLQGSFGAALVPLSQSVMLDSTPLAERGSAMAIWGVGVMLGPIMGPTLGGWLTDHYSWHWVFLINLPIGIFTVAGLMVFMDETEIDTGRRFDWFGFLALAAGIGALQIMLDRGEQLGWFSSTEIVVELIVAIVGFYFFFAHSLTTDQPFVRFAIFRDRNFVTSFAFMAFLGVGLYGTMALVSPFMQNIIGYPVTTAGWLLGTRGIGTLVAMMAVGPPDAHHRGALAIVDRARPVCRNALPDGAVHGPDLRPPPSWRSASCRASRSACCSCRYRPLRSSPSAANCAPTGTAMLTLIRNVFSSIGISVMIAEAHQLDDHHARKARGRRDPPVQQRAADAQRHPRPSTWQPTPGRALLDAIVTQQAVIIAYANDYKLMLVLALAVMPLVLAVGSSRAVQPARGGGAVHAMD